MSRTSFPEDVATELHAARIKWPRNAHLFAALTEEVGEVARALLDAEPKENLRSECIQVAALAQRIAEEGDGRFDGWTGTGF
jgi:hypothetical protein